MKKITFRVLFILIIVFQLPLLSFAGDTPSQDIMDAAQKGMGIFVKETDGVSLGKAFHVYTIAPYDILNEDLAQDIQSNATPTSQWQTMILKEGEAISLLTVDLVNEKWMPVSLGAAGLASQLSGILETWPESEGYDYRLIRIYQATSDIIELTQGGNLLGFIPLGTARVSIGLAEQEFNAQNLRTASEIIEVVQPIVEKNLQME
jgi:hypothetical protein